MRNDELHDKKKENTIQTEPKEMSVSDTRGKGGKQKTASAVKSNIDMPNQSQSTKLRPELVKSNTQPFQERKPDPPPAAQRSVSTEKGEETHRGVQNNPSSNSTAYGKITCVSSRFGMKTFTVVPPKPSVAHSGTGEQAGTLTAGAIKIDDQGNMVKAGFFRNRADDSFKSEFNCKEETLLLGKAKAFWNSQENAVPNSKGPVDRAKENMDNLKTTPTAVFEKTSNTGKRKTEMVQPEKLFQQEAKEPVKDIQVAKEEEAEVESKVSVSKYIHLPSNKPALPPLLQKDSKRDLSFLKPSRRTSSHYVASAITRYAPKTLVKPNSIANIPESSVSVKAVTSTQVNPHQSSQSSLSNSRKTDFVSKPNPPDPVRSVSYPEFMSDSQRDTGEVRVDRQAFGSCVGSTKGSSDVQETAKNEHMQSSDPVKIKVTASNDNVKHIRSASPTPTQSSLLHSSVKLHTAPKTISQGQTSVSMD